MDGPRAAKVLLFEGFRLDLTGGGLFRLDHTGTATPVSISSRALDLLSLLAERQGQLVSKDAIMEVVWPGMVVEEGNLTVQISALRRVLDENREAGSCIQTVPGRGYRFVALSHGSSPQADRKVIPFRQWERSFDRRECEITRSGHARPDRQHARSDIASAPWASRPHHGCVVGTLCFVSVAIAVVRWHWPWSGETRPVPRLSIIVLPFANLSDDREQQYFADGITEDLTTELSRIAPMFVISDRTAFGYRDNPNAAKQIDRELGVRYVVEGSVRRSGQEVRVDAKLIDAESGALLWAERFDRDTGDFFRLQDEMTSRIAIALNLELLAAAATRPVEHPDALDYLLQGRAVYLRVPVRDGHAEAISLFERALALDPDPSKRRAGWQWRSRPAYSTKSRTQPNRHLPSKRARRPSPGGIASRPTCPLCQGPVAPCPASVRRRRSRIRGSNRVQSQLGERVRRPRLVKFLGRIHRASSIADGTSRPTQPSRSADW